MDPVGYIAAAASFIKPGGVLDITTIPTSMEGIRSIAWAFAWMLVGFFAACEVTRQHLQALDGNPKYGKLLVRLGLFAIVWMGYNSLFIFPIKVIHIVESAVLTPSEYSSKIDVLSGIALSKVEITLFSTLSTIAAWVASYLSRLVTGVLQSLQFILLAILYFFGPFIFAAAVFEPLSNLVETWFKGIVEIALWTLLVRLLFRIMLDLGIFAVLSKEALTPNPIQFTIVNVSFVVLLFCIPSLAHRFVGGPGMGSVAQVASTFILSRAAQAGAALATGGASVAAQAGGEVVRGAAANAGPAAVGALQAVGGFAHGVQQSLKRWFGSPGSKTDARDSRDQARQSKGQDTPSPPKRERSGRA